MHAIKGGWVGQTYALAKCNDSGGKKSRIRRSKEERKAMVESFIKKYQKLNNGSFPSLNLTHKEVGGSFYTVREIVRDIIQENRVLGPSKLAIEEQNSDGFLEQYPLGSISIEPETDFSSSNNSHTSTHYTRDQHPGPIQELFVNSSIQRVNEREITNGSIQAVQKHEEIDKVINTELRAVERNGEFDKVIATELQEIDLNGSSLAVEKNEEFGKVNNIELQDEEFDNVIDTELQVVEKTEENTQEINRVLLANGSVKIEEDAAKLEACDEKVNHVAADVVVETFPLKSRLKENYGLDEISIEPRKLTPTYIQKEAEKVEIEGGHGSSQVEVSSVLGNEKAEANLAGSLSEKSCILEDEKCAENLGASVLENSTGSTSQNGITLDGHADGSVPEIKDALPGVIKRVDASNGTCTLNINVKSSTTSPDEMATKNKSSNIEGSVNSLKGSKPTLDRTKLESWEDAQGKYAKPEANPLLDFLKSFVAAFLKFWSE